MLPLVLGAALAFVLLLLALGTVPRSVLPTQLDGLVDERRQSFVSWALAVAAGTAVGVMIALAMS